MASPPYATSPSGMSPPYPSPAQIPNKKRSSTLDVNPPVKRRKPSNLASSSVHPAHPLRQTSFPPEVRSPYARSPSADAASHVSGSVVSATPSGAPKKKRGRKAKNAKGGGDDGSEQTPSLVGGRAATNVSGQGGEKDGEDDEDDEKAEMALEDVGARTQEQKQEEIRLRAMLVEAFDSQQYNRYELWRAAKLADSVVKRVRYKKSGVPGSVPGANVIILGCQCYSLAIRTSERQHRSQSSRKAFRRRNHRTGSSRARRMDLSGRKADRSPDTTTFGQRN